MRKPEIGDKVWSRFSQPKEQTLWYYRSLAEVFCEQLPGQLANELREIVEVLEASSVQTADSTTAGSESGKSQFEKLKIPAHWKAGDTSAARALGLLPAFELYENDIYRALVKQFGVGNMYILSAGWGLIDAAFLTPAYDITFSAQADNFVRRRKWDTFYDLSLIPANTTKQVVCFASKEYVPLFAALTHVVKGERIVFYNSVSPPSAPGCKLIRFETRTRTNWQYECAAAFLRGKLATSREVGPIVHNPAD